VKQLVRFSFQWSGKEDITLLFDNLFLNGCNKLRTLEITNYFSRQYYNTDTLHILLENNSFLIDVNLDSLIYSTQFLTLLSNCKFLQTIALYGLFTDNNIGGWVTIFNRCRSLVSVFGVMEKGERDRTMLQYSTLCDEKSFQVSSLLGPENLSFLCSSRNIHNLIVDASIYLDSIFIDGIPSITASLLICIGQKHPLLRDLTIVDSSLYNIHRDIDEAFTFSCVVDLYFRKCQRLEVLVMHEDLFRVVHIPQFVIHAEDGSLVPQDGAFRGDNYVTNGQYNRLICVSIKHRFSTRFNLKKH
jgi:hypothetical protein